MVDTQKTVSLFMVRGDFARTYNDLHKGDFRYPAFVSSEVRDSSDTQDLFKI